MPFCRFHNCVNGVPYELPCATSLVFDEAQGTCVREDQASEFARKCTDTQEKGVSITKKNIILVNNFFFAVGIDGFVCPDEETIGPHGQVKLMGYVIRRRFYKNLNHGQSRH